MITETEAKKKWCPFVGAHGDPQHGGGINRNPDRQRDFNCIASECMAWRLAPLSDYDEQQIRELARNTSREMAETKFQKSRLGFCGLAGKEQ